MDIITLLGLTFLPARKTFVFHTHLAVEQGKQFQAQTVFKRSAGVVAALQTDRVIKIPPHGRRALTLNCLPTSQNTSTAGATAVANVFSSQFPLLWGALPLFKPILKVKR